MRINPTTPLEKQLTRFDKELKAILLHDLNQFRNGKGKFLRNSGESKLVRTGSLLVA